MTPARWLLAAVAVPAAVLLQTGLLARLPLPGSPPDVVLVLVLAVALVAGSLPAMVLGFPAGCLADLLADHALGRLALTYVVVAYAAGGVPAERGLRAVLAVVAAGSVAALLLYAGEGLLLGDPRTSWAAIAVGLVSSVPYDVALAPFVVPVVGLLLGGRR